jgi:hypothetical protein
MKQRAPKSEDTPDLFGHRPAQGDLFAGEPPRNNGVGVAKPDEVRRRLYKLLAEARAARSKPPWSDRDTRMYQIIFPQMANWLPHSEAEQLRLEFRIELERLGHAQKS